MAENSLAMRAAEVAQVLGVSPKTVYAWAKQGKIPHIPMSQRVVLFHRAVFEEWLRKKVVGYDTAQIAEIKRVDLSVQGEREDVEPLDGDGKPTIGRAQGQGIGEVSGLVARAARQIADALSGDPGRG